MRTDHGIEIRAIRPSDRDRLDRFHERLSPATIQLRYHGPHPHLTPRELDYLVTVDGHDHVAYVACDEAGELLGVCRAIRAEHDASQAEVAIVVSDDAQGRGVGRRLLDATLVAAASEGVRAVDALILATNQRARRLFASEADRLGLPWRAGCEYGELEMHLDLEPLRRQTSFCSGSVAGLRAADSEDALALPPG